MVIEIINNIDVNIDLTTESVFLLLHEMKGVTFLDSSLANSNLGQYSFMGLDPFLTVSSKGQGTRLSGIEEGYSKEKPYVVLRRLLKKYKRDSNSNLPFETGCIGYVSYDLGKEKEVPHKNTKDSVSLPHFYFHFYDVVLSYNHKKEKWSISWDDLFENSEEKAFDLKLLLEKGTSYEKSLIDSTRNFNIKSDFNKEDYKKQIEKIRDYIYKGDVYQVNMTRQLSGMTTMTAGELYFKLRETNRAPFSAYIPVANGAILSSSPERFMEGRKGLLRTRPIKGTLPRGKTILEDEALKESLLNSEKDRAELLMIVDLERNDLGIICETGSISVSELFVIETYETVHHLVATVEGQLKEKYDVVHVLEHAFPGGSITGAPKIRAMKIIDELEENSRHIYMGSIGYIDFSGDFDFNIAIRTIIMEDNKYLFNVGGGITWNSNSESEYLETYYKAQGLLRALGGTDDVIY